MKSNKLKKWLAAPYAVWAAGFIIIPLFYEMKSFNLTDSLIPLMLIPIFCSQGAISAFMFRQFFVTVPKELEEAARLDGLNHFGIFRYDASMMLERVAKGAQALAASVYRAERFAEEQ